MSQRHLAAQIGAEATLAELAQADATALWALHARGAASFASGRPTRHLGEASWLDVKQRLGEMQMGDCQLCTWRCGTDRRAGATGRCGVADRINLTAEYLHMGEEPELVPAHTLFFTGCTMRCSFCQAWKSSYHPGAGHDVELAQLARIVQARQADGARCVNFVGGTPEPYLPLIIELANRLDPAVTLPFVFNSNATATPEALALMAGVIDLYLPDWKYGNDACSERHSDYPDYTAQLERFVGTAVRQGDLLIRHLVMPNHLDCCTEPILAWIGRHMPAVRFNLMFQYRPLYEARHDPVIGRRLTADEEQSAKALVDKYGLTNLVHRDW